MERTTVKTHFNCGAYSRYNHWRKTLSLAALGADPEEVWREMDAGLPRFAYKPFVELVWFSDCEGFIGPKTSAKLAKDFAQHRSAVIEKAYLGYDCLTDRPSPVFAEQYDLFQRAFEIASGGGVVIFA